ncbi:MAG: hypothetical protein Q9224_006587 [Gallowayella concinna]
MRFFLASNSPSALSLLFAASLFLNGVAAAVDFKLHPKLLHPLLARQSCTSSSINSKCLTVGSDPTECIDYICSSCTSVDPQIAECCKRTGTLNIAECVASIETSTSRIPTGTAFPGSSRSGSVGSFPTTSAAAAALRNPACSSLGSKLLACEVATPGFSSIRAWTSQASCFCYSGNSFAPASFDNYYSSCLRYAEASNTDLYSDLTVGVRSAISTPCAEGGDVKTTTRGRTIISTNEPAAPVGTVTGTGDAGPTSSSGGGGSSNGAGVSGENTPVASSGQGNLAVSP